MKVLVTGMTSRMVSFNREAAFPSLLARAIKDAGHSVTMRAEYSGVDDYDAVIAGIASPLSPAATYLVPTAQTIDEAVQQGKLAAIMLDDPDISKIEHGASSVLRAPERIEKPFFMSRPGMRAYMDSDSSGVRGTVLGIIETMKSWEWPTVIWPKHSWGPDRISPRISGRAIGVDVSLVLKDLIERRSAGRIEPDRAPDGAPWIIDTTYFDPDRHDPSVQKEVFEVSLGDTSLTQMRRMVEMSFGMLQSNTSMPGWWTPAPMLASFAHRTYIPSPDEGLLMGGPYYIQPSVFEALDPDAREMIIEEQIARERNILCTPMKMVHMALNGALGLPVS